MQIDKQKILNELGGIAEDFYNELVYDFISQVEVEIAKLDKAKEVDNFDEIAQIGHFIKGSAGNLRIEEIQNIAKEIELFGQEKKKDKKIIEKSMVKLKIALGELKKFLA